jgi:hypothetical protein
MIRKYKQYLCNNYQYNATPAVNNGEVEKSAVEDHN